MTRVATVDVEGVDGLQEYLEDVAKRVRHWHVAAPRFHDFLIQRTKDRWESQGASEGVKWRKGYPSQPRYKRLKTWANNGDLTILRWKNANKERLYPSWVKKNHPEHIFKVLGDRVVFGSAVPYSGRLQEGGRTAYGEQAPPYDQATLGDRSRGRFVQLFVLYIARGESRGNQWKK